jgi:hypothetical protein
MNILRRITRKIYNSFFRRKQVPFNISALLASRNAPLFKHSGNIGDVIFCCALLKSFWRYSGQKVHLHLQTDVPCIYVVDHPLKNILMSRKMADQLLPALRMQPYIANVSVGATAPENAIDLDLFRKLPIDHRTGLIQGWYQLCTDLWIDFFEPWIEASKLPEYKRTIVVSRTSRLRSSYINYKFLSDYLDDLLFVGLPEECSRFKEETGIDCRYTTVESFDHLINIINSCRLFIGNQGFSYSIAEGVKCPRVLESNSLAPNNYPLSANGRIAIFQEQFENFVRGFLPSDR